MTNFLIGIATALKCWSCGEEEANCMDPFNGEKLSGQANQIECSKKTWLAGSSPVCLKAKSSSKKMSSLMKIL